MCTNTRPITRTRPSMNSKKYLLPSQTIPPPSEDLGMPLCASTILSTRDPEKLDGVKKDLEKSIALDPNFADAYALLAYAHMSSGEREEAVASLKKALELSPRNEQYLFNLSQMYVALGKPEEATAILRPLSNSANPEIAARARDAMEQVGKMQA